MSAKSLWMPLIYLSVCLLASALFAKAGIPCAIAYLPVAIYGVIVVIHWVSEWKRNKMSMADILKKTDKEGK